MVADSGPFACALVVTEFAAIGVTAFTTTRQTGSFGLASTESVADVMARWSALMDDCRAFGAPALASAGQVHGAEIERHEGQWRGWLRGKDRDGHVTGRENVAMAVTVADCTPVFLAHESGQVGVLHAGWRGTAACILEEGLRALGVPAAEVHVHLGPSICGDCYEVGPEVIEAVCGARVAAPTLLDVRANLAERAERAGVRHVSVSEWCTRCHNDRLFSHRAGDSGRQLGVILRSSPQDAQVLQIMK